MEARREFFRQRGARVLLDDAHGERRCDAGGGQCLVVGFRHAARRRVKARDAKDVEKGAKLRENRRFDVIGPGADEYGRI